MSRFIEMWRNFALKTNQIEFMRRFLQVKRQIGSGRSEKGWAKQSNWIQLNFVRFPWVLLSYGFCSLQTSSVTQIWISNVYLYFHFIVPHNSKWTSFPWCLQIVWRKVREFKHKTFFFVDNMNNGARVYTCVYRKSHESNSCFLLRCSKFSHQKFTQPSNVLWSEC